MVSTNKLLLVAATIMLPLGAANAQAAPADGNPAPVTASSTNGDATGSATSAPAADTAATTGSATAQAAPADSPVAVAKADVKTGAPVIGTDGVTIGKVESVTADAAVISSGKARAQVPFTSLGKTDKGLVIAMSKSQFETAAARKSAS